MDSVRENSKLGGSIRLHDEAGSDADCGSWSSNVGWAFYIKNKIIAAISDFKEYGYHQHATLYTVEEEDGQRRDSLSIMIIPTAPRSVPTASGLAPPVKACKDKIYFNCWTKTTAV